MYVAVTSLCVFLEQFQNIFWLMKLHFLIISFMHHVYLCLCEWCSVLSLSKWMLIPLSISISFYLSEIKGASHHKELFLLWSEYLISITPKRCVANDISCGVHALFIILLRIVFDSGLIHQSCILYHVNKCMSAGSIRFFWDLREGVLSGSRTHTPDGIPTPNGLRSNWDFLPGRSPTVGWTNFPVNRFGARRRAWTSDQMFNEKGGGQMASWALRACS